MTVRRYAALLVSALALMAGQPGQARAEDVCVGVRVLVLGEPLLPVGPVCQPYSDSTACAHPGGGLESWAEVFTQVCAPNR